MVDGMVNLVFHGLGGRFFLLLRWGLACASLGELVMNEFDRDLLPRGARARESETEIQGIPSYPIIHFGLYYREFAASLGAAEPPW